MLRAKIDRKVSVKEFIQAIGEEVVVAQLHQDLPFEKLVEELKVDKDTSRHPIFQVMFGVQSFGGGVHKQENERTENDLTKLLEVYRTEVSLYDIAKFDISTFIDDSQICLRGSINYAVNLYTEATISGFIETYTGILKQLASLVNDKQGQERTKITDLSYLSAEKYHQIIYSWNQTDKDYPSDKTIQQLFEEQVEKSPDSIAVIYEEVKLTYRELNERGNRLANYLRQIHEVKPDTLIALCLDRSEHMLIAILGVLKAGGAYVPMDPSYPDERIKYILEDTRASIVLTNEIHQHRLEEISRINSINSRDIELNKQVEILAIDSAVLTEELSLQLTTNPYTETGSSNLAYVIYTSGTTGNPKGVLQVEHKGNVL